MPNAKREIRIRLIILNSLSNAVWEKKKILSEEPIETDVQNVPKKIYENQ